MTVLAIIHTTAATVEPLRTLAAEILPGCRVINFVDDAILPQLAENGGDVLQVADRLVHYARFAEEAGANIILEACSSVGEVVPEMRAAVTIPVVRIDEAMAEEAVHRAMQGRGRIGVAATLATTLAPTARLLEAKAEAMGQPVTIERVLVEGAYERLMDGDRDGHDKLLIDALKRLAPAVPEGGYAIDVAVLAQASMARVLPHLPVEQRDRFLTSPRLAMERVKAVLD